MKNFILVVLLLTAAAFAAFAQTGTIHMLTGDVWLKHPGSNDFIAAAAGDRVSWSTVVLTGFRSTAVVEIGSTVITVRPLTCQSLAKIQCSSKVGAVTDCLLPAPPIGTPSPVGRTPAPIVRTPAAAPPSNPDPPPPPSDPDPPPPSSGDVDIGFGY